MFINSDRVWAIPQIQYNEQIIEDINHGNDAVFATPTPVRGYVNITLGRGVYENIANENELLNISKVKGKNKAVWLLGENSDNDNNSGNQIYNWRNIIVFNNNESAITVYGKITSNELDSKKIKIHHLAIPYFIQHNPKTINIGTKEIRIKDINENGFIEIEDKIDNANIHVYSFVAKEDTISIENLTDENWTNGVNKDENILLIKNGSTPKSVLAKKRIQKNICIR